MIYNGKRLESLIDTKWAGRKLEFRECLESTNVRAKQAAEEGAPHGTLIVAEMQTAGVGRRGRSWESPAGRNIYMTLVLRPDFVPDKAAMLTLLMAHAVSRAIDEVAAGLNGGTAAGRPVAEGKTAGLNGGTAAGRPVAEGKTSGLWCGIKWPNDIVINGKKVCGILTEMSLKQNHIDYVVIGVGINVGIQDFAPELADKATSLERECGCRVPRDVLVSQVMREFEQDYERFAGVGDLRCCLEEYQGKLVNLNNQVCVLEPSGSWSGIARGITPAGELLVETKSGEVIEVYAGEVSVRGIYGYV